MLLPRTRQKTTLLITSTISPDSGVHFLKVIDYKQRLAQYLEAFEFYCKTLLSGVFDRIVYTDNSGYPLDDLVAVAERLDVRDRVEFISYKSTVSPDNSRYFLEIKLIDYAMRTSQLLNDREGLVWKVTGRYIVQNCAEIVRDWPDGADLWINCRNKPYPVVDFYFLGFRCDTFECHIGKTIDRYKGTIDGEKILRQSIDAGEFSDVAIVKRFRRPPRLYGTKGHDGSQYGGRKDTAKYFVRRLMAIVAPQVWI